MTIKDRHGNRLTLYQAKNGSVMLQFGNGAVELTQAQTEKLGSPYNIEGFDHEAYLEFYAAQLV